MAKPSAVNAEGEVSAEHPAQEVEGGSSDFFGNRCKRETLANGQPFSFVTVGEQTIVPDFRKPVRKDVQKEAPNELICGDGHDFPFVFVPIVAPLKSDPAIPNANDAVV